MDVPPADPSGSSNVVDQPGNVEQVVIRQTFVPNGFDENESTKTSQNDVHPDEPSFSPSIIVSDIATGSDEDSSVPIDPIMEHTSVTVSSSEENEDVPPVPDPDPEPSEPQPKDPISIAKAKRLHVLNEFVETERDYVRDIGSLVEGYMAEINEMELPADMEGKERIVFANIRQIHEFHRDTFLPFTEKCLEDYAVLGCAFPKYERRLHMYVVYCQNKPKSDYLVAEYKEFFSDLTSKLAQKYPDLMGHKLSLADLIIKPVQRILKYSLLLRDIRKQTERANEPLDGLDRALQTAAVVGKACDDMMEVGRLQGFDGKITAQGKLTLHETLQVSEHPANQAFKGRDRKLFLFEQMLIIADCIMPKNPGPFAKANYFHHANIKINKMALEADVPNEPLRFILKNKETNLNHGPNDFLIQSSGEEQKAVWINEIKRLLDTQNDFLRALQHPIKYQQELTGHSPGNSATNSPVPGSEKKRGANLVGRLAGHLKTNKANSSNSSPTPPQNPDGDALPRSSSGDQASTPKGNGNTLLGSSITDLTSKGKASANLDENGHHPKSARSRLFSGFKSFRVKRLTRNKE